MKPWSTRTAGVVAACGLIFSLNVGAATAGGAPASAQPAAVSGQLAARMAAVGASAVAVRKKSGKVRVTVTSRAKKVQVKYRTAMGKKKLRTKKTHQARATFSLPKGSRSIYVRARADRKLPGHGWHAVRVGAVSTPPVRVAPRPAPPSTRPPAVAVPLLAAPSVAQLAEVSHTRVFFGHQSVGANILGAVPGVFTRAGMTAPAVVEGTPPVTGGIGNAYIGENYNPSSKLADFNAWVRMRGVGSTAQVALMKLCFVDITDGFDVSGWFSKYVSTMAALEAAYPKVTFLHVTAPLTVDADGDNATRYQLNTLLRKKYASTGRLVDLAALESTRPDGSRVAGSTQGRAFEELYSGYSSDGGHLSDAGARAAASLLVRVIASAR